MSEMLDRIAEAGSTYWVLNDFVHSLQYQIIGENFDGEFYELEKDAEDACKRMNARAVLKVLMEPGEHEEKIVLAIAEVISRTSEECLSVKCTDLLGENCVCGHWARQAWTTAKQAMLTEILKE